MIKSVSLRFLLICSSERFGLFQKFLELLKTSQHLLIFLGFHIDISLSDHIFLLNWRFVLLIELRNIALHIYRQWSDISQRLNILRPLLDEHLQPLLLLYFCLELSIELVCLLQLLADLAQLLFGIFEFVAVLILKLFYLCFIFLHNQLDSLQLFLLQFFDGGLHLSFVFGNKFLNFFSGFIRLCLCFFLRSLLSFDLLL